MSVGNILHSNRFLCENCLLAKAVEAQRTAPTRDKTVVVIVRFFSADSYYVFSFGVVFGSEKSVK